jgi:hypothetical protein
MHSAGSFPTFRTNIPLHYSGWKTKLTKKKEAESAIFLRTACLFVLLLKNEDGGNMFLRNVSELLLRYRASRPRRLSSSQLPRSETLKSYIINVYRISFTSRLKPVVRRKLQNASRTMQLQVSFRTYTQTNLFCLFCVIQEHEGNLGGTHPASGLVHHSMQVSQNLRNVH